jgi:hypothetical protein
LKNVTDDTFIFYNTTANSSHILAPLPDGGRAYYGLVIVNNHNVLACGGLIGSILHFNVLPSCLLYNAGTNTWQQPEVTKYDLHSHIPTFALFKN